MGHDVVEIITSDKSIIIEVSLGEDMLNFIISQVFSQILSNLFEFKGGESSGSVDIEWLEDLVDFSSAFFVTELGGGESQEFSEVNTSWLIVIEFGENLIYEFVLSSESEAFKGSL